MRESEKPCAANSAKAASRIAACLTSGAARRGRTTGEDWLTDDLHIVLTGQYYNLSSLKLQYMKSTLAELKNYG